MIRRQKYITREDLKNNSKTIYLFGDNDYRKGLGGQAREMRGEPNAIGIRTKKYPSNQPKSFYTDKEYEHNIKNIDQDFGMVMFYMT